MNTLKVAFSLIVAWGFGVMYGIATARAASETAPAPPPSACPADAGDVSAPFAGDPASAKWCESNNGHLAIPIAVREDADGSYKVTARPYQCVMPASALQSIPRSSESAGVPFAK
jgi:hypothetical protein